MRIRSLITMSALLLTACTPSKGKVRIPATEHDDPLNIAGQTLCPGNSWDKSFPTRLMKANPNIGLDRWTLSPPKWSGGGIEVTPVPCKIAQEQPAVAAPTEPAPAKPAPEPEAKDSGATKKTDAGARPKTKRPGSRPASKRPAGKKPPVPAPAKQPEPPKDQEQGSGVL